MTVLEQAWRQKLTSRAVLALLAVGLIVALRMIGVPFLVLSRGASLLLFFGAAARLMWLSLSRHSWRPLGGSIATLIIGIAACQTAGRAPIGLLAGVVVTLVILRVAAA